MERDERRYIPLNYAQSHLNAMSGSENRRASAIPPSSAIRPSQNKENPYYNRRRTADNFPGPGLVHNGPAVVRSTLTASATMNELANPFKSSKPRFPLTKRSTPTRIPSPVWDPKGGNRYVSTPVQPSQNTPKENKNHGAQNFVPLSDKPVPLLPKSRTMGMLSSFSTPSSKHDYTPSHSHQASRSSKHPADVTPSDPDYIPLPLFTPNVHQIHASNANSYWCGRFQAACDRLGDEYLLLNSEVMRQCDTKDSDSSSSSSTLSNQENHMSNPFKDKGLQSSSRNKFTIHEDQTQDKRSSRAFHHLQSLCTNNESRRSLWEFQLQFARIKGKPDLLPKGGKMVDERGGWLGRVGRAMVGSNNKGPAPQTSLGRSRRMSSVVNFLNHKKVATGEDTNMYSMGSAITGCRSTVSNESSLEEAV